MLSLSPLSRRRSIPNRYTRCDSLERSYFFSALEYILYRFRTRRYTYSNFTRYTLLRTNTHTVTDAHTHTHMRVRSSVMCCEENCDIVQHSLELHIHIDTGIKRKLILSSFYWDSISKGYNEHLSSDLLHILLYYTFLALLM